MSARTAARVMLLVVACVLVVLAVRELSVGHAEADAADVAAAAGDWPSAILHARAAAEGLVPGSPWPARGLAQLEVIGHDAEVRADDETALLAYGALRTATLATQTGLSTGHALAIAEGGLARVAGSRGDSSARRAAAASMLEALRIDAQVSPGAPAPWAHLVLAASALALVGGSARLAWIAEGSRGPHGAQALVVAGFVGYALVLLRH